MFPSVTTTFTRKGLGCLFQSLWGSTYKSKSKSMDPWTKKRSESMSLWSAVLDITDLSINIPDLYISSSSSFNINLWDPTDRRRYPQTCRGKPWAPCSCRGRGRGRWGDSCFLGRSRAPGCPGRFPLLGQYFGWWRGWKDAPAEGMGQWNC